MLVMMLGPRATILVLVWKRYWGIALLSGRHPDYATGALQARLLNATALPPLNNATAPRNRNLVESMKLDLGWACRTPHTGRSRPPAALCAPRAPLRTGGRPVL